MEQERDNSGGLNTETKKDLKVVGKATDEDLVKLFAPKSIFDE
jgi:hypothetical protein